MKKIKNKILAGVSFLFVIILLLGIAGIIFVNRLYHNTSGTIQNNYRSIAYTAEMNKSLQNIMASYSSNHLYSATLRKDIAVLDSNIYLESSNITEIGEKELVQELKDGYRKYLGILNQLVNNSTSVNYGESFLESSGNMERIVRDIYSINMDAVYRRSAEASNAASRATLIMIVLTALCVLITLPLVIYFPKWITNPVKVLTEKINEIASGKYNQKLDLHRQDELGELASSFNTMAMKLREYETSNLQTLLSEKRRLDAVIQNLQDGVIILDRDNRIIKINQTAIRLTGADEKSIIRMIASEVGLKNDLFRTILNSLDNHNEDAKPLKIIYDGEEQYFSVEAVSTSPSEELEGGKVILIHNITQYQKRDAAKTNLIATVSHELKTPISSINLSLKLLDDARIGGLNEEQKKLVYALRQQSNRLSKVINELLDFSQAETGNIKLNITSVLPEDIVDLSVTALMMIMSEKNINLETEMEDKLPAVKADFEKTTWVLVNILGNAVRYTPNGGTITLRVCRENGYVRFSVLDEGPGIPVEEMGKVFDKFVKVGKPSSGTGLGLAIAKEFVQSQGGKIGVQNNKDKGAEFYFVLNCASKDKI